MGVSGTKMKIPEKMKGKAAETQPTTLQVSCQTKGVLHCNAKYKKELGEEAQRSGVPRNFFRGGPTNSVEGRGKRERGFGGAVAP